MFGHSTTQNIVTADRVHQYRQVELCVRGWVKGGVKNSICSASEFQRRSDINDASQLQWLRDINGARISMSPGRQSAL